MRDINLSLQEAFRVELYRLVNKVDRIFYALEIQDGRGSMEDFITLPQKKNFIRILKNMDMEGLKGWLEDIIERADAYFSSFPRGYLLTKDFIIKEARKAWEDEETAGYFAEEEINLSKLSHLFDGRKVLESVKAILLGICQKRKEAQKKEISLPIQKALEYIKERYKEPVTMEEVADICGLSPNYFSVMFKEQMGLTSTI